MPMMSASKSLMRHLERITGRKRTDTSGTETGSILWIVDAKGFEGIR